MTHFILDKNQNPLTEIMNLNENNDNISEKFMDNMWDDLSLAPYLQSTKKRTNLSSYKARANKSCLTQRWRKRNNTKDLTYWKSIDLVSYFDSHSVINDDQTSCNETKVGQCKRKKPKIPELLSMMHCQAKVIEDALISS